MSSLTPPITPENALEVLADWARPGSYASVDGDWVHRLCAEVQKKVEDLQSTPSPSWSPEWPTREGWYWFYGKLSDVRYRVNLYAVLVDESGIPMIGPYDLNESAGATGLWLPLETPAPPEEVPA